MTFMRNFGRCSAAIATLSVLSFSAAAQTSLNWQLEAPVQRPPPREASAMTYDPVHQQIVLFGGYNTAHLNDTWTYDGTTWTQRFPAASPPPRAAGRMAFDVPTQRVILFGGFNGAYLGDTWLWDGANWTPSLSLKGKWHSGSNSFCYVAASSCWIFLLKKSCSDLSVANSRALRKCRSAVSRWFKSASNSPSTV